MKRRWTVVVALLVAGFAAGWMVSTMGAGRAVRDAAAGVVLADSGVALAAAEVEDTRQKADSAAQAAQDAVEAAEAVEIPAPVPVAVLERVDTLLVRVQVEVPDTALANGLARALNAERAAHTAEVDSLRSAVEVLQGSVSELTLALGVSRDYTRALENENAALRTRVEAGDRLATALRRERGLSILERAAWAGGGLAVGFMGGAIVGAAR